MVQQQTFVNTPPPMVQQTFVTPPLINPNPVIQTTTYGGGGFYQPGPMNGGAALNNGSARPLPYSAPQQAPQMFMPVMNDSEVNQDGYEFEDNTSPENEPPLLEELGINFRHIADKTIAVLNPIREPSSELLGDTDLAGPLIFCLAFGVCLLLAGKVHFGYIYLIAVVGCLSMYALLNLMSQQGVSLILTVSILGYCLLPMVPLSLMAVVFSLRSLLGQIVVVVITLWSSFAASKLFSQSLTMSGQQALIAYPCFIIYGVFALLAVF